MLFEVMDIYEFHMIPTINFDTDFLQFEILRSVQVKTYFEKF